MRISWMMMVAVAFFQTCKGVSACNITNCADEVCTDNSCKICQDGYYRTFNGNCTTCRLDGCKCSIKKDCTGCLPGRYGPNCQYFCKKECVKCTAEYVCSECISGSYGEYCQHKCPYNCKSCISDTNCTECKPSKYGSQCNLNCQVGCKDELCDIQTGSCSNGCLPAHIMVPVDNCLPCPSVCTSCTSGSQCLQCKPGQWGPACQFQCTGCQDNCSKDTGCLSDCSDGFYKYLDSNKAGYICLECPATCSKCSSMYNCDECKHGYWGSRCQHNCTLCKTGGCKKNIGCESGCQNGYFQEVIGNGFICTRCHGSCETCTNELQCTSCQDGFYMTENNNCALCPSQCASGTTCSKDNGTCIHGCIRGKSGEKCNEECNSRCQDCDQYDSLRCVSCQMGYYGRNCEKSCSYACRPNERNICDKTTGHCMNGCLDGFWGDKCNSVCSDGCQTSICNTVGSCVKGCKLNYYGNRCEARCSDYCNLPSEGISVRRCNEINGACLTSCVDGWYGLTCNRSCNGKCLDSTCHRYDGSCNHGCRVSWYGEKCDRQCSRNCNGSACERNTGVCSYGCDFGFSGLTCSTDVSSNAQQNQGQEATIIGLSVSLCLVGLLAILLASVLFIVLKNRQNLQSTYETSVTQEQHNSDRHVQQKEYEGLERNGDVSQVYSVITTDYEN